MTPRNRKLVTAVLACALGFGGLGAAVFLARDDWNWAKPLLSRWVGRATGRQLAIAGDLRVDLGLRTDVTAHGVHFGNAPWASTPEMFSAERLSLRLRLAPLLRGRVRLERLAGTGIRLALEKRATGENNWTIGKPDAASEPTSLPTAIDLRAADLTLADPSRPRGFALHVDALASRVLGGVRLLEATGVYQQESFHAQAGFLGRPREGASRVLTSLRARVGGTTASAQGWVGGSTGDSRFELRLAARGESLDDLWRLVGFPLPRTPKFSFAGHLTYGGGRIGIERLSGRLGRSDIRGDLAVDLARGKRMRIEADLRSHAVDLDDVEGFWGRPPREEEAAAPAAPPGAPAALFPDVKFELGKLRVADAEIRFAADRVQGETVLDHVRLTAHLADGVLALRPLALGMSAGDLSTNAVLDARTAEPTLSAEIVLRRVQLEELLARAGARDGAGGELGGRAELRTHGSSLRELARHADGEVGAVLQGGWISDPLLELFALHLGGYIRARLDKDEPGPIRCLVGVFDAQQGVLAARTLLLDTSHVRIEGEGRIDLAQESIDLELKQHSKHLTFGALKTPIEIVGPLAERTARLKPGPLMARGGAAVALGAIHPLAALLALVDPGRDDKPGACREALGEFGEIAPSVPASAAAGKNAEGAVPE